MEAGSCRIGVPPVFVSCISSHSSSYSSSPSSSSFPRYSPPLSSSFSPPPKPLRKVVIVLPVIEKFRKKEKVEEGKFYDSYYYYDYKGQEEETDYRKLQTKLGFWEWPDWSIVLISVFIFGFGGVVCACGLCAYGGVYEDIEDEAEVACWGYDDLGR